MGARSAAEPIARVIRVPPTANASRPATGTITGRTIASPPPTASAVHALSRSGAHTTRRAHGLASATLPTSATPAHAPAPKSISTNGIHPADSTSSTGTARKVSAPKVPAFTSAVRPSSDAVRPARSATSSARREGRSPPPGSIGPAARIARKGGTHSAATDQNRARHPAAAPTRAPAGTPATMATVVPASSSDSARARRSGPTAAAATVNATARKPALANAATTRVPSSTGRDAVSAPTTCAAANTARKPSRAARGGHRRANVAVAGAPRTIPAAKAETRLPAADGATDRSVASAGSTPASMNSEVPIAKTARARNRTSRGTEDSWDEGNEDIVSGRRGRLGPADQRTTARLCTGPTAGPATPTSCDSGVLTSATLAPGRRRAPPDNAAPRTRRSPRDVPGASQRMCAYS
ncbi:Uncharacterised protein (plasmid) [Tsukamurella tyrosinosolvens]|uniref:Uncharacterized protein n=1 Tax=Tsukamurella tyrosinosolvens TaxID=57704 RepID=A0A1H5B3U3_TSUTY|nr:hypothetical protein AXK58_10615 [Tsukamurella tyrosinosolvens]SED49359.1 hypothetical protein SAMN04489793_5080 [Tsukamurella tyrosinosolvens]VEH88918.1 Uncharacterised protein [Tsukamurella tyrosinosolvens]